MKKMTMLVTLPTEGRTRDFLSEETLRIMEENFDVEYNDKPVPMTDEELCERIAGKDIIVTAWGSPHIFAAPLKEHAPKLVAHLCGTVADLVDESVFNAGVKVICGNEYFAESVAEGCVGYIISALRRIPLLVSSLKGGSWREDVVVSNGLLDKTVGLVGFGSITKHLVKMLKPFRVKLKIYSGYPIDEKYLEENNAIQADLDEIFSTCDVVSLHSAMTERTRGMIRGSHFRLMKPDAVFINTARGPIIREAEMIEALLERDDIIAMLDVYEVESLPVDSPLRSMKNVYCMPHMGGPTMDRRPYIGQRVIEDAVRFSKGEELTLEVSASRAKSMTKH